MDAERELHPIEMKKEITRAYDGFLEKGSEDLGLNQMDDKKELNPIVRRYFEFIRRCDWWPDREKSSMEKFYESLDDDDQIKKRIEKEIIKEDDKRTEGRIKAAEKFNEEQELNRIPPTPFVPWSLRPGETDE